MIGKADVFVQNPAPGAATHLGVGAQAMGAASPRLIHVSISGYGEDGPYCDQKAYDLRIQGKKRAAVGQWHARGQRVWEFRSAILP